MRKDCFRFRLYKAGKN
ncbi:KxYKxGKxW signal peptide domain-containing protein [Microcystis sp. 0824]